MNFPKDELADNEFYHGTSNYKAIQILYEGFRLKKKYCLYGRYGTFKEGIYLTKSMDVAEMFAYGDVIFKCKLSDKASILRIDEKYDKKVIDSLKREFGKNILTGDINKAIPSNKHLKNKELINLLNYRFCKGSWKRKVKWKWDDVLPSIRHQLKLHKYDAIGSAESEVGIAVFNPALVKPLKIFHFGYNKGQKPFLKELDKKKFIYELEQMILEIRDCCEEQDEREELDYIGSLLLRFRCENRLCES